MSEPLVPHQRPRLISTLLVVAIFGCALCVGWLYISATERLMQEQAQERDQARFLELRTRLERAVEQHFEKAVLLAGALSVSPETEDQLAARIQRIRDHLRNGGQQGPTELSVWQHDGFLVPPGHESALLPGSHGGAPGVAQAYRSALLEFGDAPQELPAILLPLGGTDPRDHLIAVASIESETPGAAALLILETHLGYLLEELDGSADRHGLRLEVRAARHDSALNGEYSTGNGSAPPFKPAVPDYESAFTRGNMLWTLKAWRQQALPGAPAATWPLTVLLSALMAFLFYNAAYYRLMLQLRIDEIRGVLAQKEAQTATLLQAAPVALLSTAPDGTVELAEGRRLEAICPANPQGRPFQQVFAGHPEILRHFQQAQEGRQITSRLTLPAGSFDLVLAPRAAAESNAQRHGVVAIALDVTERHKAEQALKESEAVLRELYTATTSPDLTLEEKIERLLELGTRYFRTDCGMFTRFDGDSCVVQTLFDPSGRLQNGMRLPLGSTFCSVVLDRGAPLVLEDTRSSEHAGHPSVEEMGIAAYFGTPVFHDQRILGTLTFLGLQGPVPGLQAKQVLLRLMGDWVGGELARRDMTSQMRLMLKAEEAISEISSSLLNLAPDQSDQAIELALQDLGGLTETQHVLLYLRSEATGGLHLQWEWHEAPGMRTPRRLETIDPEQWPWLAGNLQRQEVLPIHDRDDLPGAARRSRRFLKHLNLRRLSLVRIGPPQAMSGLLLMAGTQTETLPASKILRLLTVVGESLFSLLQRRHVMEQLVGQQEQLKSILATLDAVVWSGDPINHRMLYLSPAAQALYGRPVQDFIEDKDAWWSVIHPDDKQRASRYTHLLHEYGFVRMEYRIVRPDGSIRWVSDRARLVTDASGQPLRLDGIVLDITERVLAEQQRLEAEQRYRAVVEDQSELICRFERGGLTTFVNPAFARAIGHMAEDLIGENFFALVNLNPDPVEGMHPEEDRSQLAPLEGKESPSPRWVEWTIRPIGEEDAPTEFQAVGRDVTSSREAQEALQRNEAILRLFVDHTPAAIAMFDRQMKYLMYSRQWRLDYGLGDTELLGRSHYEVFPEIGEEWKRIHAQCLQGQVATREEDSFPRADGSHDYVRWEIHPWYSENGEVGGLIMFTQVITEKRRAELALLQSQQQLKRVVQSAPIFYLTADPEGMITLAEGKGLESVVHEGENLLGRSLEQIFSDYAEVRRDWKRALAGEAFSTICEFGSLAFETWFAPLEDAQGQMVGAMAVGTDVTGRHLAEDALRESEDRFRQLASAAYEGIIIHRGGVILDLNEQVGKMFGVPVRDLIGARVRSLFPPQDRSRVEERLGEGIDTPLQTQGLRSDGTRFPVELRDQHLDYQGTPAHVATIRDVTRQKQAETELRRAKEAAEEAAAIKTQFLANMSHEIRTPLNAVIGMMELLLLSTLTPAQKEYAATAKSSGELLLNIINDILDFSKIEAGKLELDPRPFDLRRCVEEVSKLLAFRAAGKGLRLELDLAPGIPDVLIGDAGRLHQILINLLSNAIKFTHKGGVFLRVRLSEQPGGGVYLFEVQDTGIGIPEDRLDRLFLPFSQVDASTTRQYGGTGLGLAISRQLIQAMGGRIWMNSKLGEGTTFSFQIPFQPAPRGAAAEPLEPARSPSSSLVPLPQINGTHTESAAQGAASPLPIEFPAEFSVLVAEDNEVNQRVASHLLNRLGLACTLAGTGLEAVDCCRGQRFDLILMDCQMPEMDGYEATRQIRALDQKGHRPYIVAMTANALKGDRERCLAAGMDDYISKPVSLSALGSALERLAAFTPPPHPFTEPMARMATEHNEPAVNLERLADMVGHEEEAQRQIAHLFLTDTNRRVRELEAPVLAQEPEKVRRGAHGIKGAAANLGAETLRQTAESLERAGKLGEAGKFSDLYRQLQEHFGQAREFLEKRFGKPVA